MARKIVKPNIAPTPATVSIPMQAVQQNSFNIPIPHLLAALLALIIVLAHKLPLATSTFRLAMVFLVYVIAMVSFLDNLPIVLLFTLLLLHAVYQYKMTQTHEKTSNSN